MGYTDLDFEGAPEKITLYRSGTSLEVKKEEGGNKYGLFTMDGDNQFSKLGFSARKADGSISIFPQGQYTIKANVTSLTINGSDVDESTDLISWTAVLNPARPTESYGENITEPGENNVFTLVNNDVEANAAEGDFTEELCRTFPAYLKGQKITTSAYKDTNAYLFNGVCNVAAYPDADLSYDLTYKVDDIELYYLAPVKVTFNNGGVEGADFSGDSTEFYINNGASIKPSDYKYSHTSDKLFTGWKDQNGNTVWGTINPTEDITLTARWEDAYSEDYGMLIAAVDFEKLAVGSTFTPNNTRYLAKNYGVVAPVLPDDFPEDVYFSVSANGATVEGTDTDKYLSMYTVKNSGKGKESWPRFSFITKDESGSHLYNAPGTYTMIWTLKQDTERAVNSTISLNGANIYWWNGTKYSEVNKGFSSTGYNTITSGTKTGWTATNGVVSILNGESVNTSIGVFKGIGAFQAMPTVKVTDAGVEETVYKVDSATGEPTSTVDYYICSYENYTLMDDIKLYYRAPVELNFVDPDGYATDLVENLTIKYNTTATLPTLTTDTPGVSFMGWSYEEDGNVINASSIKPSEDTTLYARWATTENHPQFGKVIFDLNFENSQDFSNSAMYRHGYVNSDDENAKTWYMTSSGLTNLAIYGENKDGVVVWKNGEKVETEGVTDYEVVNKFLGANGATGLNPQFVPTTGYNGKSNLTTFADKGIFTIVSNLAYDMGETNANTITSTHDYQFRLYTHYWTDAEHTTSAWKHDSLLAHKEVIPRTNGENVWSTRMATSDGSASFDATKITISGTTYDVKETSSLFRFLIYYTYKNAFPYTDTNGNGKRDNDEPYTDDGSEDFFKLDDVILYWKPYTANLTIDMVEDNGLTLEGLTNYDTTNIVDLSAILGDNDNKVFNGRIFKGLSKTQGGEVLTEDFYLTEDTTLYALWRDDYSGTIPTTSTENSIRTDSYHGIRFKASVLTQQREVAEEYGFIVTRASILDTLGLEYTGLNFNMPEKTFASGAAYNKAEGIDFKYDVTAEEIFFTGVFVGVPATMANYTEEIVARPYIKYADGKYYYGAPHGRTILSVAEAIRDAGYPDMSDSAIEKIKDILEICGKPNEKNALITADGDNGQLYGCVKEDGITSVGSNNVKISVVDDPLNSGKGKVYFVDGTLLGGSANGPHTYIWFKNPGMKAGATYKVSYDILAHDLDAGGNDINDETKFASDIVTKSGGSTNFQYYDTAKSTTVNHTTAGYTAYTDKWVTVNATITLSEALDESRANQWGLYVSPRATTAIEGSSILYARSVYIDNLKIVEVTE